MPAYFAAYFWQAPKGGRAKRRQGKPNKTTFFPKEPTLLPNKPPNVPTSQKGAYFSAGANVPTLEACQNVPTLLCLHTFWYAGRSKRRQGKGAYFWHASFCNQKEADKRAYFHCLLLGSARSRHERCLLSKRCLLLRQRCLLLPTSCLLLASSKRRQAKGGRPFPIVPTFQRIAFEANSFFLPATEPPHLNSNIMQIAAKR